MIISFRSKPLKLYYEKGDVSKLPADQLTRIQNILTRLDIATKPEQLNVPGYDYHQLKGNLSGFYSVKVKNNFKIIFQFADENVLDVDYLDYH